MRFPGLHPSPLGDLGVGEDVTENSPQHEKALVRDRHRRELGWDRRAIGPGSHTIFHKVLGVWEGTH